MVNKKKMFILCSVNKIGDDIDQLGRIMMCTYLKKRFMYTGF